MWPGCAVGMNVSLRLSRFSALHSSLFTAALGEHMDNAFSHVVESKQEMEFDCDETW
jgi:hypothetical protein